MANINQTTTLKHSTYILPSYRYYSRNKQSGQYQVKFVQGVKKTMLCLHLSSASQTIDRRFY